MTSHDSSFYRLVSLYLSNALSSDVIWDHVMSHDSRQLQIAHTWLRCVVQMYTPPACVEHVKQLTKLVCELLIVCDYWRCSMCRCIVRMNLIGSFQHAPVNTEPMATLKVLLEAINNKHSTAVSYCK